MHEASPQPPADRTPAIGSWRRSAVWGGIVLGLLVLLVLLGPILMPFVVGAALAYIGDPLVDRLERLRLSRTGAVTLVFVVVIALWVLAALLLLPLLGKQVEILMHNLPVWLHWVQDKGLPALGIRLPAGLSFDTDSLRSLIERNWHAARGMLGGLLGQLGRSTPSLLATTVNLLLIPIVTFYLLRDWDDLVDRVRNLVPPRHRTRVDALAREVDDVLGSFIRGQLLVMLSLGLIYGVGLWIAGLNVALLIGLAAGILSFIPYLGFISGLLAASVAMLVQTQDATSLLWVLGVFGIGQIMESAVLTPLLVGDRIGLHPVAVIFAVLAGGQLFGFLGVLLALPVSAVLAVALRHARRHWLASALYDGDAS